MTEDNDATSVHRKKIFQKFIERESVSLDKDAVLQLIVLFSEQAFYNRILLNALMKSVVEEVKITDFEEIIKLNDEIDESRYAFIESLIDSEGKSE